ncbi:PqqD family protein [Emticicia sp. TH156]|uniref:PqqD family protein n=1 Tax=Emticicia sp. TH156 TaxID=2067454 RepID=UPI000C781B71|nr:PqqD family protein [Emticicia sp. TH156]PLK43452.1 PqqD family protein [Emticicia sp. TH156]
MYAINENRILLTELGDEGILFDLQTNDYVSLNETLFKIMKGIEQGNNIDAIIEQLCNEFQVSEADCRADVNLALTELEAKTYIVKCVS